MTVSAPCEPPQIRARHRRGLGRRRFVPDTLAAWDKPSSCSEDGMKRLTWLLGTVALMASAPCMAEAGKDVSIGPVALTVRLPDPGQKLLYVHEVIPAKPGPLTLYYPKWIPGDHTPDGPIEQIMGLQFTAGGQRVAWQRDELDRFAFHLTVPAGGQQLEVDFQFPAEKRVTPNLIDLTWDHVALYQAGSPTKTQ